MNAKERLRRYLEQRRELGESELVLDGLPVDDVMAMLGARGDGARKAPKAGPSDPPVESRSESLATDLPVADAAAAPVKTEATPPPEPERRFDESSPTDWREALRRAGAMKPDRPTQPDLLPDLPAAASAASASAASAPLAVPAWLAALDIPIGLSAGLASVQQLEPAIASLPTLDALAEMTRACTRCDLYRTATHAVPGEGNPDADFVCVGEAPGQNEDEQGRPFVGAAGSLLNKILGAIQLKREDVFICNVLKHRPPGNRDPLPDEVRACEPYLRRQLELVKPSVILALGRFAAQSLLQTTTPIGKLRGQVHRYHGIPLIVTYHPAALLRNEAWKRPAWEDVKLARRILDAARAAS
ncbi:MAG TPA: uracil-DNA glycosylase [Gemmatimonas sp.]|nr:uracil-DNA glycosylase [Gemmatimonas sp.]